ncbi:MAG: CAP domain-containing protein [Desulfobacteraceae bacterium]|nr:CAP domain-containing protein [Desulfobacteraceae bacterium]
MRKAFCLLLILTSLMLALPCSGSSRERMPVPPSNKRPDASEIERAEKMYYLIRRENRRIAWDNCLARKAFLRAKELVTKGYFDHRDPVTGRNPVYARLHEDCFRDAATFGENLTMGADTPENIHKALMDSPTHRKNIINPSYSRVGVGCYEDICVELFAGF